MVGSDEGWKVGSVVGVEEGKSVGLTLGLNEGETVGSMVGAKVGHCVQPSHPIQLHFRFQGLGLVKQNAAQSHTNHSILFSCCMIEATDHVR